MFAEKWKAIQGDIVMGPVGEALGPLLTKFFSGMKKMKKSTVKQIGTTCTWYWSLLVLYLVK